MERSREKVGRAEVGAAGDARHDRHLGQACKEGDVLGERAEGDAEDGHGAVGAGLVAVVGVVDGVGQGQRGRLRDALRAQLKRHAGR